MMNRFEKSPHFKTLPGVKLKDKPFVLTQSLLYYTDVLPDKPILDMPVGLRSDLLTIPRIFRRVISVAFWGRDAAWPHDYCVDPVDKYGNKIPHFCSHKEAALIFEEALMDSVNQMNLTVREYKRKRLTAKCLAWCVKVGGPKFKAGE